MEVVTSVVICTVYLPTDLSWRRKNQIAMNGQLLYRQVVEEALTLFCWTWRLEIRQRSGFKTEVRVQKTKRRLCQHSAASA